MKLKRSPFSNQLVDGSGHKANTEELEKELAWLAGNYPSSPEMRDIFDALVERGIKPAGAHYEALILSNCDPQHGSVANVQAVLDEMRQTGVTLSGSTYGAVLKVTFPASILSCAYNNIGSRRPS
jgi:hypothetical protein